MKQFTLPWWYDDGTLYRQTDGLILAGCENHQDEEYHLTHDEAVKWIDKYCSRLSDDKQIFWNKEITS